MEKRKKYFLLITSIYLANAIFGATTFAHANKKDTNGKVSQKNEPKQNIYINFEEESLTEIINQLAKLKNVNIILPQPNTITQKVTFFKEKPVTKEEAFNLLYSILDYAGYSLIEQKGTFVVIKNDKNITKESLKIFIGTHYDALPSTDERIRYICTLENIQVPKQNPQNDPLAVILKDILSKPPESLIIFDSKTNSIILTDKAYNIKMAMKIIHEMDHTGFREAIEIIPLYHTQASFITNGKDGILDKLIGKDVKQVGARSILVTKPSSLYFSPTTKVVPEERTNSLIIMGKKEDVQRIKNFILKYIDRPMEDGNSILHIYHLKHLTAETFGPILSKILKPSGSAQQSSGGSTAPQNFKNVVIVGEKQEAKSTAGQSSGGAGTKYSGNRLVIAARKNDWLRIKELIDELDKPQLQVALEILVVDISTNLEKILGSQTRNRSDFGLYDGVNFQAANSAPAITKSTTAVDALKANMLDSSIVGTSATKSGAAIFTLKDSTDNTMWSIFKLVDRSKSTDILSHPFLITKNTNKATLSVGETRITDSGSPTVKDGGTSVSFDTLEASLTVNITPIISPKSKMINLDIDIEVTNFVTTSNQTRAKRSISTNANIRNKEVLVLGGLTKTSNETNKIPTPILGQIPILGWMFKHKSNVFTKSNLTVFICPTILNVGEDAHKSMFTKEKLAYSRQVFGEANIFSDLRDPISRWFFKSPVNEEEHVKSFFEDRFKSREKKQEKAAPIKEDSFKQKNTNDQKIIELFKDEKSPVPKNETGQQIKS